MKPSWAKYTIAIFFPDKQNRIIVLINFSELINQVSGIPSNTRLVPQTAVNSYFHMLIISDTLIVNNVYAKITFFEFEKAGIWGTERKKEEI